MSTDISAQQTSLRAGRMAAENASPFGSYSQWSEQEGGEPSFQPRVDPQQLTQILGWFSIGLGLTQIIAPRALGRAIGVGDHPTVMRLCGVREVTNGVALLSQRAPQAWAWTRVAGDALDLALLGVAARNPDADPKRIAAAATAVLGVTALDVYAGQTLNRTELSVPIEEVSASIAINSTPEALYTFWKNVENLPRFMTHLRSVSATNERVSHWVATAPAGASVEWDSEITADEPNKRLSWRTLPDSEVIHEGTVTFEPDPSGRGSIVRVQMRYEPPAGKIGVQFARLLGEEPRQQIQSDLRRLKQLIETGEVATTLGQPCGRRSLLGRSTLGRRIQ